MKRVMMPAVFCLLILLCGCSVKEQSQAEGFDGHDEEFGQAGDVDKNQAEDIEDIKDADSVGIIDGIEDKDKDVKMERADYRLFVNPKNAWVGDVMPMTDEHGIQIYYLYETDNNGMGFHPIHKYSTNNLYEYSDDGLMVPYGTSVEEEDLAIGTGSVIYADGQYHCFYTGHNYLFPDKGKDKECIMHAVSDDNVHFTKIPEDTVYAHDTYDGDNFRDPFVFYNAEDACYWMLISTRENNQAIIALYKSDDLQTWAVSDPLYRSDKQHMMECADVFELGGKYYMFYSWDLVTYYAMSDSVYGPYVAPEDNTLDGKAFYAAKSTEYQGKRYLFGWIGRKEEEKDTNPYGWAGNMCVYEIGQKADGSLTAKMPDTYYTYFQNEIPFDKVEVLQGADIQGDVLTVQAEKDEVAGVSLGTLPATGLITGTVRIDEATIGGGFFFGHDGEFSNAFGILLDPVNDMIRYDHSTLARMRYSVPDVYSPFSFELGKEYDINLVIENEIIVLYLNEEKVLSSRIYKAEGKGFGVFSVGGDVVFSDLKLYIP